MTLNDAKNIETDERILNLMILLQESNIRADSNNQTVIIQEDVFDDKRFMCIEPLGTDLNKPWIVKNYLYELYIASWPMCTEETVKYIKKEIKEIKMMVE